MPPPPGWVHVTHELLLFQPRKLVAYFSYTKVDIELNDFTSFSHTNIRIRHLPIKGHGEEYKNACSYCWI